MHAYRQKCTPEIFVVIMSSITDKFSLNNCGVVVDYPKRSYGGVRLTTNIVHNKVKKSDTILKQTIIKSGFS